MSDFETVPVGTMAELERLRAEMKALRKQEPVAYRYVYDDPFGRGGNVTSMQPTLNGCKPKESEPLYASPVPPPDVNQSEAIRELVELLSNIKGTGFLTPTFDSSWTHRDICKRADTVLAKFRGQS